MAIADKDPGDIEDQLKKDGWIKVENKNSNTTYKKNYWNTYYLSHESSNIEHSSDKKPTKYWKIGKMHTNEKNTIFRPTGAKNFKSSKGTVIRKK